MTTKRKKKKAVMHVEKHVHRDCSHKKLGYCKRCDTVYCGAKGCSAEWKRSAYSYTLTYPSNYLSGIGSATTVNSVNPVASTDVNIDHSTHDMAN